jgi:hypothetical protein
MALETATYVANLVVTNPDDADAVNAGDDHIRLIKAALRRTFPNLDGPVSLSALQVSYVGDLSASVQAQLNALRAGSATVNAAIFANSASFATFAGHAASASYAASAGAALTALTANSASFATFAGHAQSASYAANAGNATTANTALNATNATDAVNAQNATFASTCTSASSAALLTGLSGDTAATGSTVAVRNSSAYLFAAYFNQGSSGSESISVGQVFAETNGDGYLRKVTPALLGAYMDARNITNKTGTAKTLASGSGPPSLTGSTNGDMWFYYTP